MSIQRKVILEKYVVNPVVVRMQESAKGSIYQSIVAMGFRARQINDDFKAELGRRMEGVAVNTNDETEGGNDDQIKISREFDKYPKPTFLAMKEISDGKLHFEMPEDDTTVEFE